jgi:hypothetical protein
MIRAILDGAKTQTRRLVTPSPGLQKTWLTNESLASVPHGRMFDGGWQMHHPRAGQVMQGPLGPVHVAYDSPFGWVKCPYGQPGDRLWVRETWDVPPGSERADEAVYRADFTADQEVEAKQLARLAPGLAHRWRPSIHMPRWASRITLEVTGVRVERLQDISDADVAAEGIGVTHALDPQSAFQRLWNSINGARGQWASNPWAWVISFRRVSP